MVDADLLEELRRISASCDRPQAIARTVLVKDADTLEALFPRERATPDGLS